MKHATSSGAMPHIVGIGASAGGLEALQNFFQHLDPETPAAYVVIQHLSPDFKSVMQDLLSKTTSVAVQNVEDRMLIVEKNIYLIPPRHNMVVENGYLRLIEHAERRGLNLPIDIFFSSLAQNSGSNCSAIILSGTGSDGSRGILDIKEAGGVVMVQDQQDAKFDGMPKSAMLKNLPDIVDTADELPLHIARLLDKDQSSSVSYSDEGALNEIFELLRRRTGVDFSKYKLTTVSRRIERRMHVNSISNVQAYQAMMADDPVESDILCRELLINVTRFFRDKDAFEVLDKEVVRKVAAQARGKREVRVWCVGCATGEEAYSIAILLAEALEGADGMNSFKVFATDVDKEVIVKAAAGTYDPAIVEDLGSARIQQHLTVNGNGTYSISPWLRSRVVFAVHDITKDPPFTNMDLVVCRNMLIYLRADVQQQVLGHLFYAVRPGSYLFLGSSESLGEMADHFDTLNQRQKIFQKTGAGLPNRSSMLITREPERTRDVRTRNKTQLSGILADNLLDRYLPPTLVVDQKDEAVYVYGEIAPFTQKLQPGSVLNQLSSLLVEPLRIPVSTAVLRARGNDEEVLYDGISFVAENDAEISVTIRVAPIHSPQLVQHLAISFEEVTTVAPEDAATRINFAPSQQAQQRIADLQNELKHTREHLQVTVEELETTNEELQASNEELLAANEELQSTNEELQSVNEELYTVNSEYQEKIQEISFVNDDLENVLTTTSLAIIFLDENLVIRRFTESASSFFNIVSQDLGRPIHHVTHQLNYGRFMDDVSGVLADRKRVKKKVESVSGEQIIVKIDPFTPRNQSPSGLVITLQDATLSHNIEQKLLSAEEELQKRAYERQFDIALDVAKIGVWRWDVVTATLHWDSRMYNMANLQGSSTRPSMGLIAEVAHPIDRQRVKGALDDILVTGVGDIQFRTLIDGETRMTHIFGEPIANEENVMHSIVGVWADTTRQRMTALDELALDTESKADPEQINILIVEDDEQDASLVQQYIRRSEPSWKTQCAPTLEAGVSMVAKGGFSAALVDLSLPDAIAEEAVATLHKVNESLPLLVLTGSEDDSVLEKVIGFGAHDFLVKRNLTSDSIVWAIRKCLKRVDTSSVVSSES